MYCVIIYSNRVTLHVVQCYCLICEEYFQSKMPLQFAAAIYTFTTQM